MRFLASLLFSFFLVTFCNYASAQYAKKKDSLYFLLDTIKTPYNDRMWDISFEGNKYYTILCPCLRYNGRPTFLLLKSNKIIFIDNKALVKLRKIKIISLINLAKSGAEDGSFNKLHNMFIIEPKAKQYAVSKVALMPPSDRRPSIDIETVH
jgi:hypothetical protein